MYKLQKQLGIFTSVLWSHWLGDINDTAVKNLLQQFPNTLLADPA